LVYALSFGASYWLGLENGICGRRWHGTKSICSASSQGSSTMLAVVKFEKSRFHLYVKSILCGNYFLLLSCKSRRFIVEYEMRKEKNIV
jgi:hypothetical protein